MKNKVGVIYILQVNKPVNQVLSSLVDQDVGHQNDNHNLSAAELHRTYSVDEFEVRIMEPDKNGGPWQTRATIPMQSSENALTVRVVTLFVSSLFFLCYGLGFFCCDNSSEKESNV